MLEDKIKDVEVEENEFLLSLHNTLKTYSQEKYKIEQAELQIASMVMDVHLYKKLNFKLKYFYSKEENQYYFTFSSKNEAGFKNE